MSALEGERHDVEAALDGLASDGTAPFDLRDEAAAAAVLEAADRVVEMGADPTGIRALEAELAASAPPAPLAPRLALKLARSKALTRRLASPAFLSVVFAVYRERERAMRVQDHPHGEDFLRRKVAQLAWLSDGNAHFDWELIVVDDGCPDASGEAMERIVADEGLGDRVRVLFLARAIEEGLPVTRPLRTADDSRKGGAIEYGMWEAAQQVRPGHVVAFTDADLSTHLGQSGLLLAPVRSGCLAAVGSRREPESVVVKGRARDDRGKLFIYLWKRMLAPLASITDTQCGFKAFDARLVPELVTDTLEKQFAFDIELMLRTELMRPGSIARIPIAWIDSEALSTTTDLQPYLPMLRKVASMYRRYLPTDPGAEAFAAFVESLDQATWARLIDDIPEEIRSRDPRELAAFDGPSADDLSART